MMAGAADGAFAASLLEQRLPVGSHRDTLQSNDVVAIFQHAGLGQSVRSLSSAECCDDFHCFSRNKKKEDHQARTVGARLFVATSWV